jgi:DNA-directed RNA polymerase subunit beta'
VDKQFRKGIITDRERHNMVVDLWTHAGEHITQNLFRTLEFNDGKKMANPLYMMVTSGARGNKQQIKQLGGMRGLMAKPSGEIIERPITSNFREGLTVQEYFISTHGARKGLSDTALKTADSGYMTRKLVDVAQDVIVTEDDCGTTNGIVVCSIYEGDEEVVDLKTRIYGRGSCESHKDPVTKENIVKAGDIITEKQAIKLTDIGVEQMKIRSVLTCESRRGCCVKCYGLHLGTGYVVKVGEAVGIVAAQSIGEPGTQLTMRTFHIGGVAGGSFKQPIVKVKNTGTIRYNDLRTVKGVDGKWVVLNKNGSISLHDDDGREVESHKLVIGSLIFIEDGAKIKKGDTLVTWEQHAVPVITEKAGNVDFRDMIPNITLGKSGEKGSEVLVVLEHKEDLHPQIVIVDPKSKDILAAYTIPAGANLVVKKGDHVPAGTILAKTPRKASKAKDITGGLPRVAELFEARKPKDHAEIAKIDGVVQIGGLVRGKRKVIITDPDSGEEEEHLVPRSKHIIVFDGDTMKKGDQITEGPVVPHEILDILGPHELQQHLVNEVQEVYRLQGVEINDKHIEIIIRQMLRKVKITDPGDTEFLWGDQIERTTFEEANRVMLEQGGKPAEGEPVLLGITKASLETESFISAASFQDTTRVLTDAATLGKVDILRGFKENVIMGHLIPAGTGFTTSRDIRVKENRAELSSEGLDEVDNEADMLESV